MSILVVGSVALDSVQTPFGRIKEALGGSATYFAAASRMYNPVNLVAVVGTDFPQEHVQSFREWGVNLDGLQVAEGKTFRWSGRYGYDMNTAETLDTQLNVFATFHPELPESYKESEFVFLANIDPVLQLEILSQIRKPRLTVLDTMNYWINYRKDALTRVMSAVDIVLLNEAETRQYGNTFSLIRSARKILSLGPKALVVKKGEYGAVLFANGGELNDSFFFVPAYPLEKIQDPTGAGDSFAGGFIGYLASRGSTEMADLRRAMVHGSVVASYTVEDFGLGRLRALTREQVQQRYLDFKRFTNFEPTCPWSDSCSHLASVEGGLEGH
ncbi:MAG: 2-dehydro-3-deoxygluconokinase [Chloroflexi bacterium ADurb.Bin180]|nr:MAG: 2-dehydro-3-deoxygluconokinase [Chloroflexi bacterium ADurb.Bin180]HOU23966.1 PfkB family carbohydrate kinase [Anaerolineae bacterium]HQJ51807.1 PfkB family carbohydrate kinase [Anaerolineae bacterium]